MLTQVDGGLSRIPGESHANNNVTAVSIARLTWLYPSPSIAAIQGVASGHHPWYSLIDVDMHNLFARSFSGGHRAHCTSLQLFVRCLKDTLTSKVNYGFCCKTPLLRKFGISKKINQGQKIDCRAFVSEKYFRYLSKQTFSTESNGRPRIQPASALPDHTFPQRAGSYLTSAEDECYRSNLVKRL